jgi:hypothetical protein
VLAHVIPGALRKASERTSPLEQVERQVDEKVLANTAARGVEGFCAAIAKQSAQNAIGRTELQSQLRLLGILTCRREPP